MNPNPLSSLNHLTVPVAIAQPVLRCSSVPVSAGPDGAQPTKQVGRPAKRPSGEGPRRSCDHGRMTQARSGDGWAPTSIDELGDGEKVALEPGGVVRVDAATVRMLRNTGDEDAVYVVVGGADGDVGRDGRLPKDETERVRQTS